MKNALLTFCFLLLGALLFAQNSPLQIMSFNIRLATKDDGYNYWGNRTELVKSMIQYHEADIVGLQEAMKVQLDDFTKMLPDYEWFGLCRTDGSTNPNPDNEFSAILYKKDRFERLDGATFWLSDQPDKVGSKGWDAALPRIVTWAKFRDKQSGKTFFHFNTHFDHMGVKAREESAKLILDRIAKIAGDVPVVLTGDFNCNETEAPYRAITNTSDKRSLKDALLISKIPHHGPLSTWSGFNFPGVPGRRIDFIFVNDKILVQKHAILAESWSGRFPSDHLPVIAKLVVE